MKKLLSAALVAALLLTGTGYTVPLQSPAAADSASVSVPRQLTATSAADPASVDATVWVDTNSVLEDHYLGIGFQWDPSDSHDFTEDQWKRIFERVGFTKAPIVRVMIRSGFYNKGFDSKGKPIYDWNTSEMKRTYKILNYCQSHGIKVIFGEWGKPEEALTGISASDDPAWAEMIGDAMDYLINKKDYKVIEYYNYINEPNGNWAGAAIEEGDRFAIWKRGISNLATVFKEKGLDRKITILGPDSTGADEWVDYTAAQLPNAMSAYEVHRYATDSFVLNGEVEHLARTKREVINKTDPNGVDKPFFMAEAGLVDGKIEAHDQQPRVKNFDYGVLMSDYAIQTIRGGMAGMISWMLDDAMHNAPGSTQNNELFKVWGFWNTLGDQQDQKLRPWYYPMSLFSRFFPQGSKTVYTSDSGVKPLRVASAVIPNKGKDDITVAVVNDSDTPRTVKIKVPGAPGKTVITRYDYFDGNRPTDVEGFAVPSGTISNADLAEGIDIQLAGRGVVFLTTMNNNPITLNKNTNLALDKTVEAGSVGYKTLYPASNATDGNNTTPWVSKRSNSQWVKVDLGSKQMVNRVKINWDEGFGKYYKIETSVNGTDWTPVFHTSVGDGGIDDIVFTSTEARYIRMNGTQSGTPYGYSIKELEVYNIPGLPITEVPAAPTSINDKLDNWNLSTSHSSGLLLDSSNVQYFNGDASRAKRGGVGTESIVYRLDNIRDFTAKIYYSAPIEGVVKFYGSKDGINWTDLDAGQDLPADTADGWKVTTFKQIGTIPDETNYLKVEFTGGDETQPWSPQLGEIAINQ